MHLMYYWPTFHSSQDYHYNRTPNPTKNLIILNFVHTYITNLFALLAKMEKG